MTGLSSLGWFILGGLWVVGIVLAWTFMKAFGKNKTDYMSDEWVEKRRRFKEDER